MRKFITAILFLFVLTTTSADQGAASSPPPDWYLAEIARLTNGSGRWVADNSQYRSDDEPFQSYVTEWIASFDQTTMRGRLYGVADGTESADFWEFRQYWHPGRAEAIVEQFGARGAVGVGTLWPAEGKMRSQQDFWFPVGSTAQTGHISFFPDDATHITESFDIVADEWIPRRRYTWHRDDGPE